MKHLKLSLIAIFASLFISSTLFSAPLYQIPEYILKDTDIKIDPVRPITSTFLQLPKRKMKIVIEEMGSGDEIHSFLNQIFNENGPVQRAAITSILNSISRYSTDPDFNMNVFDLLKSFWLEEVSYPIKDRVQFIAGQNKSPKELRRFYRGLLLVRRNFVNYLSTRDDFESYMLWRESREDLTDEEQKEENPRLLANRFLIMSERHREFYVKNLIEEKMLTNFIAYIFKESTESGFSPTENQKVFLKLQSVLTKLNNKTTLMNLINKTIYRYILSAEIVIEQSDLRRKIGIALAKYLLFLNSDESLSRLQQLIEQIKVTSLDITIPTELKDATFSSKTRSFSTRLGSLLHKVEYMTQSLEERLPKLNESAKMCGIHLLASQLIVISEK